jgi:hypothetical protein
MRSVGLLLVVALGLAGCSSEPPANDRLPTTPADPDADLHAPPSSSKEIIKAAAADLRATERFKADVLDVRGVMNRSAESVATGDLEAELRRALADAGLHVLARIDPKPSERAALAVPVCGFVDGDRDFLHLHFEAAVESPTSAGPARVVWAFDRTSTVVEKPTPGSEAVWISRDAATDLTKHLSKDDAVQVLPVTDRTGKFPVLAFDACFRARLVRRGIPVVWRRAAGVDAPIGMGAATSPEKRVDLPSINGEVTEAPGGGSILVLKLERVNPATKKLEIVAQFDRKLP